MLDGACFVILTASGESNKRLMAEAVGNFSEAVEIVMKIDGAEGPVKA